MHSRFYRGIMKNAYFIAFSSLKEGKHLFNYEIENSFFEQFDFSEIEKGSLKVELELEKKSTLMNAKFQINGMVEVMCDRCTDNYNQDVNATNKLVYKFSNEEMDDENIIVVFPNEFQIDVSHSIYEFIITALPSKKLHPNQACNEEMLKIMDKYLLISTDEEE